MCEPNHLVFQLFGRVGTSICMDPTVYQLFSRGRGNWIYANISKHLAFQLFRGVGTWICMAPDIQCFNWVVGCEHRYVWTQTFSFSIVQKLYVHYTLYSFFPRDLNPCIYSLFEKLSTNSELTIHVNLVHWINICFVK
jgi:hypothetical protein